MSEPRTCPLCGSEIFNNHAYSRLSNMAIVGGKDVYVTFKVETYTQGDEKPKELEICSECLTTLLINWGKVLERGLQEADLQFAERLDRIHSLLSSAKELPENVVWQIMHDSNEK